MRGSGGNVAEQLVDRNSEHLRILSLFQYASAGVTALVGSFPLIHVAIGIAVLLMPESVRGTGQNAFPREIGFVFVGFGLVFVTVAWTLAGAQFLTARFVVRRRHYWFCVATSAVCCIACTFAAGIIGIGSLLILLRGEVKELFDANSDGQTAVP
jgi:hypothetical protein